MVLLILVTIIVIIVTSLFITFKYIDGYWERRGVFTYRPKTKRENDIFETYKHIKAKGLKHGALVKFYKATFVTIDLDNIKAILIKDADYFLNRSMISNPKRDPPSGSLPRLENADWKSVRHVLSPIFSSGKMKMIFPDIAAHAKIMQEVLAEHAESNKPFEARDMAKRFGMDSMGSCTFGFEINTLKGHNQEFVELVKNFMLITWRKIVENIVNRDLIKFLRIKMYDPKIYAYVNKIVNDVSEHREKNNIKRNDIFQYVQQITDKEIDDRDMVRNKKLSRVQMTLALQSFFVGGFETSSTLTSFALLELALNQDKQDKLRENIREALSKHGELTYDALVEMNYLEWVINESLRKYPPSQYISRLCNKTYRIPDSNIVINPGDCVSIPVVGIQMDPDYYPNPEKFEPERFNSENKAQRHPMTFLPFGDGPRNCIGARLGQIISKVAVAATISQFKVTLNNKTVTPIRFKKRTLFLEADGGVWLNCVKIG